MLKLKRIITLLSVTFLFSVLLIALSTTCAFAAEETTTGPAILLEIKNLRESGKNSNANINQTIIDLTNVTTGSAIEIIFKGEDEERTENLFDVIPQSKESALNLVTNFISKLINNYSPEEIAYTVAGNTVKTYTYGQFKDGATSDLTKGLLLIFSDQALDYLRQSGKKSDDRINHAIVDLSNISEGIVTANAYATASEEETVNVYENILRQTHKSCFNKLTRFIFELTNRYRPEVTGLILQTDNDNAIARVWTYGQYKDQALFAFLAGLPDCLGNEPYSRDDSGGGGSWIDDYSPPKIGKDPIESFQVTKITTFKINNTSYTSAVITEDDETEEIKSMDVEPYIKNDRTYVPVRYLAYALGVSEGGISWDVKTQKVGIFKDKYNIVLTIGSTTMLANKKTVIMDVAPEITRGRTMLPARWVAEALGAEVEWDEKTGEITIKQGL